MLAGKLRRVYAGRRGAFEGQSVRCGRVRCYAIVGRHCRPPVVGLKTAGEIAVTLASHAQLPDGWLNRV